MCCWPLLGRCWNPAGTCADEHTHVDMLTVCLANQGCTGKTADISITITVSGWGSPEAADVANPTQARSFHQA